MSRALGLVVSILWKRRHALASKGLRMVPIVIMSDGLGGLESFIAEANVVSVAWFLVLGYFVVVLGFWTGGLAG